MDNITMCSKMRIYEKPGERVICILSSGNLSLTQATIALIDEDLVPRRPAIRTANKSRTDRRFTKPFGMSDPRFARWKNEIAPHSRPTASISIFI